MRIESILIHEFGHVVQGAGFDKEQHARAKKAFEAAAALGLSEGAIHAELRLHNGEAWVIEIAGRSIGGLCASVLRFSGMPLEEILLRRALGRELPPLERDGGAVGVGPGARVSQRGDRRQRSRACTT